MTNRIDILLKAKFLFSVLLIVISQNVIAQLWTEDFESEGEGVSYFSTGPYFGNINNHFGRTDGTNITGGYTNWSNNFFWATEDTDDPLGDGFPQDTITFSSIDISGLSWFLFSGLFAEGTGNDWDSDDIFTIEYSLDGGLWTALMNFTTPTAGIDLGLFYDTNLDGFGDGDNVSSTFKRFEKQLFVSGTNLEIRIIIKTDVGGEEVAFDNLQLEDASILIAGCNDVNALNYNPSAEMNDGSCYDASVIVFDFAFDPNNFVIEVGQTVTWFNFLGFHNIDGTFDAINGVNFNNPENFFMGPGPAGSEWQYVFNIPGHYNYNCSIGDHALNGMVGSFDVGIGGCMNNLATNYDPLAEFDDGSCLINGCTNLIAINFDPLATVDDGSCLVPGCTYPLADNYDPSINFDDGTCTFDNLSALCLGDTDGNNVVNVLDLVNVSSNFGNTCP